MKNLITFFKEFRYFKEYLFREIRLKTAERSMAGFIKKKEYLMKHNIVSEELFLNYKNLCEGTREQKLDALNYLTKKFN